MSNWHDPLLHPGPLPKPQLQPLWSGAVSPGHDAILHCKGSLRRVPHITFELLQEGKGVVTRSYSPENLVLTYVGPQHAGNYTCRYSSWPFVSDLSDPVELRVAGEVPLRGLSTRFFPTAACPPAPRLCPD